MASGWLADDWVVHELGDGAIEYAAQFGSGLAFDGLERPRAEKAVVFALLQDALDREIFIVCGPVFGAVAVGVENRCWGVGGECKWGDVHDF